METKSKHRWAEIVTVLVALVFFFVIAAILIPQFIEANIESDRGEGLGHDLVVIRPRIELYKLYNNDDPPSIAAGVTFGQSLIQKANTESSLVDSTLNPTGCYGPYLPEIPESCYNCLGMVEIDGVLGGGFCGWCFNTTTCEFHADTDGYTER
jgi:hypothetical protein